MIMSNRGANCTLCFPGMRELNLKVCLGRLNTESFVQENSKLAEPIAPEGHLWGTACAKHLCWCGNTFCGCRLQLSLSEGFPQMSEHLGAPSRCNAICSSGSRLYFWKVVPKTEAGVPQEAAVWGTLGSSCRRNRSPGSVQCWVLTLERPVLTRKMSLVEVLDLTQKLPTRVFIYPARKRCWQSQV